MSTYRHLFLQNWCPRRGPCQIMDNTNTIMKTLLQTVPHRIQLLLVSVLHLAVAYALVML